MNYPFADSTLITCDSILWTCDWDWPIAELITGASAITALLADNSLITILLSKNSTITTTETENSKVLV